MMRSTAERLVLAQVAGTLVELGFDEVFPLEQRAKLSTTECALLQTEFDSLVKELRRRGAPNGVAPEKP